MDNWFSRVNPRELCCDTYTLVLQTLESHSFNVQCLAFTKTLSHWSMSIVTVNLQKILEEIALVAHSINDIACLEIIGSFGLELGVYVICHPCRSTKPSGTCGNPLSFLKGHLCDLFPLAPFVHHKQHRIFVPLWVSQSLGESPEALQNHLEELGWWYAKFMLIPHAKQCLLPTTHKHPQSCLKLEILVKTIYAWYLSICEEFKQVLFWRWSQMSPLLSLFFIWKTEG